MNRNKQEKCTEVLVQGVITIVKDAFFTGLKELHSYDPLKCQLVLHYIFHIRIGLRRIKQQARLSKPNFIILETKGFQIRPTNRLVCVRVCTNMVYN